MCDVTAAVVGVTAVAGAAAAASNKPKAQTQTQTSQTTTEPWAVQQPYISETFMEGQRNYEAAKRNGVWEGDTSAGMDPLSREGLSSAVDYARGTGGALAGQANNAAGALLGASQGFVDRANSMATNGAGPANSTASGVLTAAANGAPLAGTTQAAESGLEGQRGALTTAQGLVQQAQGDPAARALAMGGNYANDPTVQAQIDAAARDVTRTFSEQTMPGLNARASAGGNLNSARAGAAEAVAARGAQDRIADTAAAIRGNAFNTGVGASLTGNAQNNDLALGANAQTGSISGALSGLGEEQRQFDTSTRVGAAAALGQQDTANRALDAETRLQANAQAGQAALSGFDAANSAGALSDANAGRLIGAGTAYQSEEQRAMDEAQERYYRDYNWRQGLLTDYRGNVAGTNWGQASSGTQTTTGSAPQGPSVVQGALGGATAGLGLMSGYSRTAPTVGGNLKYI